MPVFGRGDDADYGCLRQQKRYRCKRRGRRRKEAAGGGHQPYAFAFAKGSSLVDQVNTALQELLQDGTVEKLFQEYDTVYVSPLS